MVNDVLPWEEMKLRMLNGSHSFLAYLGYLSGFAHISDCMQDRAFRHAARTLMLDECIDSLEVRKKPGGHWIIRDLMGLDLVGLASL